MNKFLSLNIKFMFSVFNYIVLIATNDLFTSLEIGKPEAGKATSKPSLSAVAASQHRRDIGIEKMAYLQYGKNVLRRGSDRGMHHPLLYAAQGVRYRKLEVILTTTIDKLGKAGETVKVAPGFFRNHLMPKLLAVPNIDKFAHLIRDQRKINQPKEVEEAKVVSKTEENNMKEYQAAADRLAKSTLRIRRFIIEGKGTDLRDPLTKEEILAEVGRQLQVHIEPENLNLPTPLSSLGEYKVPLRLPKSIPKPAGEEWILNVKIRKR